MENLEDVFVTEGVPKFTFVKPPNYTALLVDIRRAGKPVVIEGQSGTGKTTTIKMALAEIFPDAVPTLLTPREPTHLPIIQAIGLNSGNKTFVVDDFHRLDKDTKESLADLAKVIAERDNRETLPKLILIGINNIGADLIKLVPDVAKRIGIHRITPGTFELISEIISLGSKKLNIEIEKPELIFKESQGDYWLTQSICRAICIRYNVDKTKNDLIMVNWENTEIKKAVVSNLYHNYDSAVKEFCRGRRFRSTNDPYYKLLRAVSEQTESNVDLNEIANARPDIRGSINNVKDHRLKVLLEQKESCSRLFYYDSDTKNFAIEDPALFFYIKNLDWEALRQRCGFREGIKDFEWDIAISFAGENRAFASFITDQLKELDISVFYDRNYEDNYLGGLWSENFLNIFQNKSRLVVVILDEHHKSKVWPTFERDCFRSRISEGEVIPVFLDKTIFPGIPTDLVSIHFNFSGDVDAQRDKIIDDVVLRIAGKLDQC